MRLLLLKPGIFVVVVPDLFLCSRRAVDIAEVAARHLHGHATAGFLAWFETNDQAVDTHVLGVVVS